MAGVFLIPDMPIGRKQPEEGHTNMERTCKLYKEMFQLTLVGFDAIYNANTTFHS